ncbi:GNAT family N-acetyltransferase [Angustibacter sp. McL0619]|uniref:GNAT family N-acetyltransferase n=1 Tax=Angustibacter sp. McL0619 TaxID=3415676 RepID=UPI003CEFE0CB
MHTSWQRTGRAGLAEAAALLNAWEVPGGYAGALHAGDVGWHARLCDAEVDGTVRMLRLGEEVIGVGLFEPGLVRWRAAPDHRDDGALAQQVALEASGCRGQDGTVEAEVDTGSPLRAELARCGWRLGEPWVVGYLSFAELSTDAGNTDAGNTDAGTRPVDPTRDVQARVDVQRASWDHSTFTQDGYRRLLACPAYDPALDVVAYDEHGRAVASATAWSAGPGRCGILEPVGTHREHRGQGHGRRAVLAAARALVATGASGIAVATPATNTAAVAAYRSYGLEPVEHRRAMVLQS